MWARTLANIMHVYYWPHTINCCHVVKQVGSLLTLGLPAKSIFSSLLSITYYSIVFFVLFVGLSHYNTNVHIVANCDRETYRWKNLADTFIQGDIQGEDTRKKTQKLKRYSISVYQISSKKPISNIPNMYVCIYIYLLSISTQCFALKKNW